jgi:50S ribosomal subunit-associated GTPase HflX
MGLTSGEGESRWYILVRMCRNKWSHLKQEQGEEGITGEGESRWYILVRMCRNKWSHLKQEQGEEGNTGSALLVL